MTARSIDLAAIEPVAVAGGLMLPVRRTLGVTGFGINAYVGREAGDQVIEEHDELGEGSAHHEEVYLVLAGHARFTVDERVIEAPAGTLVLVPDPESRRAAIAVAPATTVVVVGGRPGAALPAAPYEHWFAAEPAYVAGRYDEAYAIAAEGLVDWPDHGHLNYQARLLRVARRPYRGGARAPAPRLPRRARAGGGVGGGRQRSRPPARAAGLAGKRDERPVAGALVREGRLGGVCMPGRIRRPARLPRGAREEGGEP